jgi:hypothetical protein
VSELDDIRRRHERRIIRENGVPLLMDGNTIDTTAEVIHMSDPLDPNPGNLRKHFVEDPEFRTRVRGPYKDTDPTAVTMSDHPMPKEEQRAIESLKGMCCTGYADRDPILSDDDIYTLPNPEQEMGAVCARRYYEERITSGELMTKEQAERMAEDAVDRYKSDYADEHRWDE